jgi:hypothetical protein
MGARVTTATLSRIDTAVKAVAAVELCLPEWRPEDKAALAIWNMVEQSGQQTLSWIEYAHVIRHYLGAEDGE